MKRAFRIVGIVALIPVGLVLLGCLSVEVISLVHRTSRPQETTGAFEAGQVFSPVVGCAYGLFDGAEATKDGKVRIWYYQTWLNGEGEYEIRRSLLVSATDVIFRDRDTSSPCFDKKLDKLVIPRD